MVDGKIVGTVCNDVKTFVILFRPYKFRVIGFKIYVDFINIFSLTGLDISLIHCFCRNFDNWWLSWGLKIKGGLKR